MSDSRQSKPSLAQSLAAPATSRVKISLSPPPLDDLLALVADEPQNTLFRELLAIEISHRSKQWETPDTGESLSCIREF